MWSVSSPIGQDGPGETLTELARMLAFRILFDTQTGWGAATATSLQLFTEALQGLHSFQAQPAVQASTLQHTAELLEKALVVDPGYVAAKYDLALVQHNLGEHQRAIETLKTLRLQPDHGIAQEIAYNLGTAYYHSLSYRAYDQAEQEFLSVLRSEQQQDAKPYYSRAAAR